MAKMSSLERTMTVIQNRIPDRIPVDLHNFLPAIKFANLPLAETLQNGEMLAESQLLFWKEFGHDVLLVENGTVGEAQACGCQVDYFDDQPAFVATHVLADGLDRVRDLDVPDPFSTAPMSEILKAVAILRREIGDKVFIMGRADQGPVALAAALRGYEQFIMDITLNEEPNLIQEVLDYCTRVHIRYGLALKEAGAHGTSMGELGVSMIGPKLYRSVAYPYDCKVVQALGSKDFPYAIHICGDSTLILKDMISTQAQILELDYKTNMATAKELIRGKTTFLGPINPELIWSAKSSEVVTQACKEAIEILAPGGNFILGPGCALSLTTPWVNVHALIESAKIYGVYNPDGTLRN